MRGYMFRNRWGAVLFVAMILAGVSRLVGTGNGDGAIDAATKRLADQKATVDALSDQGGGRAARRAAKVVFTPDEELIDQALGEDPTPIDQRAVAVAEDPDEAPHDTIFIVSDETAQPEGSQ